jgi:hypothetical protein
MKLTEAKIIEQRVAYNQLVESICKGMDTSQRKTILEAKASARNINRVLREAQLSTAQINALFGAVEQNATDSGSNRTIVGKGKDVVNAVNDGINKVGRALQNTAPVKAFDQKFEQLKGSVSAKFPELEKQLSAIGEYAKQNPGKTQAIVTVLTILAGVATGGTGGAIAGQLLRGSLELMKGEKLSTAIGKGAKTAAIGFVTGVISDKIGDMFSGDPESVAQVSGGITSDDMQGVSARPGISFAKAREVLKLDDAGAQDYIVSVQANQLSDNLMYQGGPGTVSMGGEMLDKVKDAIEFSGDVNGDWSTALDGSFVRGNLFLTPDEMAAFDASGLDIMSGEATTWLADNVAGAADQFRVNAVYDSVDYSGQNTLSETAIFKLFTAVAYKQPLVESQYVDEAPIGDMIKKAGSAVAGAAKSAAGAAGDAIKKGASAVAQQAATTGKNITTKVTVDKLMKAWEKAGSPNNDEKVAEFLTGFGIEPRAVQAAFKTAKLEVPKDAPMDQVEVIVSQAKQNSKLKDAIVAYLEGPTKRTPDTGLGQQPQTATA